MTASAAQLVKELSSTIQGKTILVLGATPKSYGHEFLRAIAPASPKAFIVGTRSPDKLTSIKDDFAPVPVETFTIDMMSFASVRAAAEGLKARTDTIDVLVNSIGTMCTPWQKSEDGWESQLQANHLGFFLFTNLILEKLVKDRTRIVNVSSEGYCMGSGIRYLDPNFHDGEVYNPGWAYGQAKTGQILFAAALARRYGDQGIVACSVQPGPNTQGTNLGAGWAITPQEFGYEFKRLGLLPPGQSPPPFGSMDTALSNYVYGAFHPAIQEHNGAYIRTAKVVDPDTMYPWGVGPAQEKRCWEFSEKCVGQAFPA